MDYKTKSLAVPGPPPRFSISPTKRINQNLHLNLKFDLGKIGKIKSHKVPTSTGPAALVIAEESKDEHKTSSYDEKSSIEETEEK